MQTQFVIAMQHTNNIMLHSYVSSFCWMVFFSCVCVCEKLCTVSSFSPKMGYSARAWLMIKDHANIPYTITNHRTVSLLISSILYHFLFYVCPLHSSYQPTCQPASNHHHSTFVCVSSTRNLAFSFDKVLCYTISFYFEIQLRPFHKNHASG